MRGKRISQEFISVAVLITAIVILFFWYTSQNSNRIEGRNKTYAEDSARQTAEQIESEFGNALLRVRNTTAEHVELIYEMPRKVWQINYQKDADISDALYALGARNM